MDRATYRAEQSARRKARREERERLFGNRLPAKAKESRADRFRALCREPHRLLMLLDMETRAQAVGHLRRGDPETVAEQLAILNAERSRLEHHLAILDRYEAHVRGQIKDRLARKHAAREAPTEEK